MGFVAISERARPGDAERLVALIYIEDEQTVWFDERGPAAYPLVEPTQEALEMLCRGSSQGDRRATFIPGGDALAELKGRVGSDRRRLTVSVRTEVRGRA